MNATDIVVFTVWGVVLGYGLKKILYKLQEIKLRLDEINDLLERERGGK